MDQYDFCRPLESEIRRLKREKKSLERSAALHRIALENIADTVIAADTAGNITYVSPKTLNAIGISRAEIYRRKTVRNLFGNQRVNLPALNGSRSPLTIDWHIKDRAGQDRFLKIDIKSVHAHMGAMVFCVRDVTALKISNQKLALRQHMVEAVFEGISDPLLMLDNRMRIKLLNTAAKRYYGLPSGSVVKDVCCFKAFKNRETPCEGCQIPPALKHREHLCYERTGFMDPRHIEQVTSYPVPERISPEGYSVVRINDITRLRRIEEELEQAGKMIALGVLVSGMAHEVNNPNNFILMNIQVLQDAWKSILPILDAHHKTHGEFSMGGLPFSEMRTELFEMLTGIEKSAHRIRQIILDLKDFAKEEDTRMDDRLDINQVIASSISLTKAFINKATGCFEYCPDERIPRIKGNAQQLEQVMINLIENACQAISQKSQSLVIRSRLDEANDRIRIEVEDEGAGIPANMVHRIMDPFITTKRKQGGTGLGLPISSKIIKRHGGAIRVESRSGEGSVFRIHLPLSDKPITHTILIVDDDPRARQLLKKILERNPRFHLHEAKNGSEALFKIGRKKPDLIILDIHMPDIDGVGVCRLIRKKKELSSIKAVITTGFINSPEVEEISKMGFDHILNKPINKRRLLKIIDRLLEETL